MIVRRTEQGFVLIRQHDHGLLAGEFARHLSPDLTLGPLTEEVLHAISDHDRAWRVPDSEVLWNHEKDMPYSFRDHPPKPKTSAYSDFLDEMERESPYSCLLCSTHYGSLAAGSKDPEDMRFVSDEKERRIRLRAVLSTGDLHDFDRDFAVLRLADDLSLFVCLNGPGGSDHPWYADGISYMGRRIVPEWEDDSTLCLDPDVLVGGFRSGLPYDVISPDGTALLSGEYELEVARKSEHPRRG